VALGQARFLVSVGPQEGVDLASVDLDLQQSKIRVDAANREVNRLKPLVAQGIVPQKRLDEVLTQLAEARAALQSAQRRQGNIGGSQRVTKTRDGLRIPSPLDGTIAELFVTNGEWVSSGQPIGRVVNAKRLWLDAAVPQAYLSRIRTMQGAWFNLEGFEQTFELGPDSLMSVASEVDASSRTLPVRFRLDNTDGRLFAGMTTIAHLITDAPQSGVAIPRSALVFDAGLDVVYVQKSGEVFERRVVVKGIQDGDYVQILRGLEPDEWIVTTGAHTIKLASVSTDEIGHGHAH
jgi:RND family efflux transporter MFP subunit